MKPFFAIIISFRGIVSVVCVRRPFPAAFPQQVSSIFIMNSLLINCRLFKINSYNLTECWCSVCSVTSGPAGLGSWWTWCFCSLHREMLQLCWWERGCTEDIEAVVRTRWVGIDPEVVSSSGVS